MLIFAWCNVLTWEVDEFCMDNFLGRESFAYRLIFRNGVQLANINPHEIQKMIYRENLSMRKFIFVGFV